MSSGLFSRFLPLPFAELTAVPVPPREGSSPTRVHAVAIAPLRESEALAALDRVAPLPSVAQKIIAMIDGKSGSTSELEQLVRLDPVIAAKLLRLVNSPFYGLPNHVASVAQAVIMIGFAGVKTLVIAASLSDVFAQDCQSYGYGELGLWKSSISGASIARAVAQQAGVPSDECEEYFLAALMRDIGVLALGPFLLNRDQRLIRDGASDVLARERKALGFDHCWAGERLADHWRLPPRLRLCMGNHHRSIAGVAEADQRILAGVRLADCLASASRIGLLANHPFDTKVDPLLVQAAGLDGPRFQALMKQLPGVILAAENQV